VSAKRFAPDEFLPMQDRLRVRAAEVTRLATTVRSNLDQAEALIPVVKAILVTRASHMVTSLMADVRLLGS
jgi:hypothetical protein